MNVTERLEKYLAKTPTLGKEVFLAKGAVVLGDVRIGDFSSVWYNTVIRGDIHEIVLGHHTNVQDNCVLHVADRYGCILGNYVTVGHSAVVHACTIQDGVLIGMNATILDGAVVGEDSIIGANAMVPQGMEIPPGSMVLGCPAKVVRPLKPEERKGRYLAEKYVEVARHYLAKGVL